MTSPISFDQSLEDLLQQFIGNANRAGEELNFTPAATDASFVNTQNDRLDTTAKSLSEAIESAQTVIAGLREQQSNTDQALSELSGVEGSHGPTENTTAPYDTPIDIDAADTTDADTVSAADTSTAETTAAPLTSPDTLTTTSSTDTNFTPARPNTGYHSVSDTNLAHIVAQRNPTDPVKAYETYPLPEARTNAVVPPTGTQLSSAPYAPTDPVDAAVHTPNETTQLSSAGGTQLSSADGATTLSASDGDDNTNKFVAYAASDDSSSDSVEYQDAPASTGYQATKQQLKEITSLVDNLSYGPEIFEDIYVEDGYYDEGSYDDMGGYAYPDLDMSAPMMEGDGMVMVGEPTDQTMIDVSQVDFSRPPDMTLSDEELNACMDEVLYRAGITDEEAAGKWRTVLKMIAEHESNFNPAAGNDWDSNAVGATQSDGLPAQSSRGLMQTIPSTFAANHMGGTSTNIYDPVASMGASVNYLMSRYGADQFGNGLDEFYSARSGTYHGY